MPPKSPPERKPSSAPPDSLPPKSDALPGDLRREDQSAVPPDSLPNADEDASGDEQGAHSLAPDGGDANHPIHDDDPTEDFTPRDYEEQIDEVADARRDQNKRAKVEER